MDHARMSLMERRGHAENQLRIERERLSTRAWWRRPTSLSTSTWVRSGGARAVTTPTTPAATMTWPTMDTSMVAQVGDHTREIEAEVEEVRIVRLLDNTMEVDGANGEEDDGKEGSGANGRGKGQDSQDDKTRRL